jgi:DNA-directed RNA polymerase specialized sigma24 family protein
MKQAAEHCVTGGVTGVEDAGWEEVVRRHGAELQRRVARELRRAGAEVQWEVVKELSQEVCCRALTGGERAPARRTKEEVLAYLQKTAVSTVVDHLREESAVKRGLDLRADLGEDAQGILENMPHPGSDPEQRLLCRERRWLFLERCTRYVGRRARRRTLCILTLAFFADWRSHEIAQALGGKPCASSIDSLVHRIKGQLTPADRELLRG